jgi:hypothetical protein
VSSAPRRLAHGDDPGAEGDRVADQAVRVPAAVPALVVVAHEQRRTLQMGHQRQDLGAEDGVTAHRGPLRLVERSRLVQDAVGDAGLPEVVQARGDGDVGQVVGPEAELAADEDGPARQHPRVPGVGAGGQIGQRGERLDHAGGDALGWGGTCMVEQGLSR